MTVDTDFCFDPDTQSECDREPSPLLKGRTVFFAVQPKFRNVDIRITVDVLVGSLDVFLSSKEDAFVVDVNKTNGIHEISFDKKYGVYRSRYLHRSVKDMIQTDDEFLDDHVDEILGPDADRIRTHLRQTFAGSNAANIFRRRKKQKRPRTFSERLQPHPDESRGNGAAGAGNTTNRVPHRVVEHVAGGLSTYITIRSPYDFLIVRGVQNRLVITLPEEVHDLRSTRFYIVLYSVGTEFQPVVDKAFAGDKNGFDFTLSAVGAKEDPAFGSVFFRQDQPRIDLFVFFSVFFSSFFLLLAVCVVAWKPCEDNVAGVGTVLVQLPGGAAVPSQLGLGSALVLLSRVYTATGRCRGSVAHGGTGCAFARRSKRNKNGKYQVSQKA
ncbi:unnamed protein product [Notodromas monacha]|uniref:Uncharacterized protein n=1 Tax=Notodromas monacha TaxID=399045 RepID=A0A7R9BHT0_9CRUS|nr:unnamed protein product [Notodromas monacha]CAG0914372.1 unnamed protein product [Notodromas monacha]